jgi:hypothetical protein
MREVLFSKSHLTLISECFAKNKASEFIFTLPAPQRPLKAKRKRSAQVSSDNILTRSKERVQQLGEVFTPDFLVQEMLNALPKEVWEDPDKNWLEPTFGSGNFVIAVIKRRLSLGQDLMQVLNTTWGFEIMEDNVLECHTRIYNEIVKPYFREDNRISKSNKCKLIECMCIVENNLRQTPDSLLENWGTHLPFFNELPEEEQVLKIGAMTDRLR